jgi:hypothetical protein
LCGCYNYTQHLALTELKLPNKGLLCLFALSHLCFTFVEPTFCLQFPSIHVVLQKWYKNEGMNGIKVYSNLDTFSKRMDFGEILYLSKCTKTTAGFMNISRKLPADCK